MGQIGQRLAQARTAKGLTLEQIQGITKIRLKYLVAIEDEDWNALPGEVYLRGFLKSYAQIVGLNPMEIMELYQPAPPPPPVEPEPRQVRPITVRTTTPSLSKAAPSSANKLAVGYSHLEPRYKQASGRIRMPMMAVMVVLLGLLVYIGYRVWQPPATIAPPTAVSGNPVTPPTTGVAGEGGKPQATTPTMVTPPVQIIKQSEAMFEVRYFVKGPQSLELKIGIKEANAGEVAGQCWIDVQSDARNVGDMMLRSGMTKEYTATDTLRLRIGNPQVAGLTLSVNGIAVPKPQTTEPLDLVFTRQTP